MAKSSFVHIGLTVADIDTTVAFYEKYFGFTLEKRIVFSPEFIAAKPTLYRQEPGVYSHMAMIKSPDGVCMELFQFVPEISAQETVWNRPGYHHICLLVKNLQETYEYMCAEGLKDSFFFEPDGMRGGNEHHWVFLKDPDGNLIELQD